MKILKLLSDNDLHVQIKIKVQEERNITLEVLHLLRETERRRSFAPLGYSSLHEYCVKELKYSDSAAQRRISSMRLLRTLPESVEALEDGQLNLSTMSAVQSFLKGQQKDNNKIYSTQEKQALMKTVEGKSVRETQKILGDLAPDINLFREKDKVLSSTKTQLLIVVDEETMQMLKKIKELKSHTNPPVGEIFKEGLKLQLEKFDRNKVRLPPAPVKQRAKNLRSNRYISATTRREVFCRDEGKCVFVDPISKRKCDSKWRLQIDHIIPFAMGGDSNPDNLRLLCQTHNLLHAKHCFGEEHTGQFLSDGL